MINNTIDQSRMQLTNQVIIEFFENDQVIHDMLQPEVVYDTDSDDSDIEEDYETDSDDEDDELPDLVSDDETDDESIDNGSQSVDGNIEIVIIPQLRRENATDYIHTPLMNRVGSVPSAPVRQRVFVSLDNLDSLDSITNTITPRRLVFN